MSATIKTKAEQGVTGSPNVGQGGQAEIFNRVMRVSLSEKADSEEMSLSHGCGEKSVTGRILRGCLLSLGRTAWGGTGNKW